MVEWQVLQDKVKWMQSKLSYDLIWAMLYWSSPGRIKKTNGPSPRNTLLWWLHKIWESFLLDANKCLECRMLHQQTDECTSSWHKESSQLLTNFSNCKLSYSGLWSVWPVSASLWDSHSTPAFLLLFTAFSIYIYIYLSDIFSVCPCGLIVLLSIN